MKDTLTADRLNELKTLVGNWAGANFDVFAPEIGIIEEVGEAAHCILKRAQGIRGFEVESFFLDKLKDAVADIAIYALHLAYLKEHDLDAVLSVEDCKGSREPEGVEGARLILAELSQAARDCIVYDGDFYIDYLMNETKRLAFHYGIDFDAAVEETWAKVCKRNWRVNPGDADAKAEAA